MYISETASVHLGLSQVIHHKIFLFFLTKPNNNEKWINSVHIGLSQVIHHTITTCHNILNEIKREKFYPMDSFLKA